MVHKKGIVDSKQLAILDGSTSCKYIRKYFNIYI